MKTTKSMWGTVPRKTVIISMIGVFFTFSTIGFANDIIEMGRQPTLRFGLAILLTGYSLCGMRLRELLFGRIGGRRHCQSLPRNSS
jgi:hypothetical protein